MCSTDGDNRLDITNRKCGNWSQSSSNVLRSNCKRVEICCKYSITRVAISLENNVMALSDKLGSICLLDTNRRQYQQSIRLKSSITCLAINDMAVDCNLVATTVDNTIHFFNYCPQRLSARLVASIASTHKTSINAISFCDQRMMSSSKGDKCLIWDLIGLKCVKQLADNQTKVSVFWSDLILTSYASRVFVIDSHNYHLLSALEDRQLLSFTTDRFFTRSKDNNCLEMHCLDSGNKLQSEVIANLTSDPKNVKEVFFCGNLWLYSTVDGFLFCKYHSFENRFTTIVSNREILVTMTTNQTVIVYDLIQINNKRLKSMKITAEEEVNEDVIRHQSDAKTVRKLALILMKKYRKLPKKYRLFIWFKLLAIPMNYSSFKIIETQALSQSSEVMTALDVLRREYEVMDTRLRECLISTIGQLVYLRPQLMEDSLSDLALFCFPFVKVLHKNQTILFESLMTLLDNHYIHSRLSRHMADVLEICDQMLRRESQSVAKHLQRLAVDARDCYLSLIVSAFSEVFLTSDWLTVWDQLLAFGPQMYVYLCVSYCLQSKDALLSLTSGERVVQFFRSQTAMRANGVIECSHRLSQKYVSLVGNELTPLPKNVYI